jgi:hypothetical protein
MSLDGFAEGHRLARAIGWLIPVAMLILVFVVLVGRGRLSGTTEVDGKVLERAGRSCLVQATDGDQVWLLCPAAVKAGMAVRMKRLEYTSGKRRYALAGDYSRP